MFCAPEQQLQTSVILAAPRYEWKEVAEQLQANYFFDTIFFHDKCLKIWAFSGIMLSALRNSAGLGPASGVGPLAAAVALQLRWQATKAGTSPKFMKGESKSAQSHVGSQDRDHVAAGAKHTVGLGWCAITNNTHSSIQAVWLHISTNQLSVVPAAAVSLPVRRASARHSLCTAARLPGGDY